MTIESFKDETLKRLDAAFEQQANNLLNSVRTFNTNSAIQIGGKMDGISESSKIIMDVFKLFVTADKSEEDDNDKPLY